MKKCKETMLFIVLLVCLCAGLALLRPGSAQAAENMSVDRLVVSGGTIGGTSNLSANAMASVIFKYCKIPTTITANSTFAQISVLQSKEADIATAVGYQAYDAYSGSWKGTPYPEVRTLLLSPICKSSTSLR